MALAFCLHCAKQRPHLPWPHPWHSKAYDLNRDGIPDVFYAPEENNVDWNGDGIPEVRRYFENGQLSLETYDLNFEGKPSLWLHYDEGKPVLKEWDNDGDGEADQQEFLLEQNLLDLLGLLLNLFTPNGSMPLPPEEMQEATLEETLKGAPATALTTPPPHPPCCLAP